MTSQAHQHYLLSLLQQLSPSWPTSSAIHRHQSSLPHNAAHTVSTCIQLQLMPGYTILILDTNILLSSLSMVPLPAIMELDELVSNTSLLSDTAKVAIAFVASHMRSYADLLKVKTLHGNYLSSLSYAPSKLTSMTLILGSGTWTISF